MDAHEKVGPDQVDDVEETEPTRTGGSRARSLRRRAGSSRSAGRIRRFPHVQQIDEMDCGAACLAMICRHFGRAVSLSRIRQLLHTSTDGTSLRALCRGARGARTRRAGGQGVARATWPRCRCPPSSTGRGTTGSSSTTWTSSTSASPTRRSGSRRIPRAEFEEKWTGYAALFDYTSAFENAPVGRSSIAWLWSFFRPFSSIFAKALALAVVVSGLQMVLPVFTQVIVDRVLVEQDVGLLNVLILCMLAVVVFSTLAMVVQRYLLSFVAVRIDSATLDFLTRRLLALPMSYFNTRRTGDIQRRLAGVRQVREFLVQQGVGGLTSIVQLVGGSRADVRLQPRPDPRLPRHGAPLRGVDVLLGEVAAARSSTRSRRRSASTTPTRSTRSRGSRPSRRWGPRAP